MLSGAEKESQQLVKATYGSNHDYISVSVAGVHQRVGQEPEIPVRQNRRNLEPVPDGSPEGHLGLEVVRDQLRLREEEEPLRQE